MELSSQLKLYGLLNETFVNKILNGKLACKIFKLIIFLFSVAGAGGFDFMVSITFNLQTETGLRRFGSHFYDN